MEKEYPVVIGGTDEQLEYEKCALCDNDAMLGHGGKGYCGGHYIEVMGWEEPADKDNDMEGAIDSMTLATLQEDGSICCQTCGSWTTMEDMKTDGKCPSCREIAMEVADV